MGKPCFSNIAKFFAIALLGAATAMAAIAVLSSPAAARPGGGGDGDEYPWDTDNLRYQSYNAKSFNIPFHDYGGYSGVAACQKNVADSFFQTDNSVVNDFPRLVPSGNANSASWSVAGGSAGNDAGCDTFVAQQDRLAAQVAARVGYALDESGNLAAAPSGAAYTTGRSAADLRYVVWRAKAASRYTLTKADNYQTINTIGATSDPSYLRRVDGIAGRLAIRPQSAGNTITVPSTSARTGNFGASWHGTKLITDVSVPSYYDTFLDRWTEESTVTRYSDVRVSSQGNLSRHLTAAKSADLCPSLFHPRGEDSVNRIGRNTGRTLSGLSHANGQTADRFWCRSDWRYERRFAVETHTLPAGIIAYPGAPASGTFTAYGRLGCYYTTTGQTPIASNADTSARKCGYMFPLPRCDSDKDGTADREYTAAEVQALRDNGNITEGQPFTIAENARCAPAAAPPDQAGFTADPCVTASLEIYENRTAGSDAEPGVPASDRTLAVASGRTAWDLDITSPHPLTASAPRDTTAGTGDPDGCADGSESRADHAASSGSAARSQSTAPSYASSARTDTAAPPNDADGDIDYTGAAKNMAHRYASRVAENTCAAKLAEAEAELSLLELREDGFAQWLADYKTAAETNASRYSSYRRTPPQSGSGLAILRFNDYEASKATYASLLSTRYTNLSSALSAARTAYDTATDRTAGSSRAAVITTSSNSGCVAHYDSEIARLKTLFANAETAAANRIRAAQTAIAQTRIAAVAAISVSPRAAFSLPSSNGVGVFSHNVVSNICRGTEDTNGNCWGPPFAPGTTCPPSSFLCAGLVEQVSTAYYTCPQRTATNTGTVTGTYGTATRTASYTAIYVAPARGATTSRNCPAFRAQTGSTFYANAVTDIRGTPGTASSLPSVASASAPATSRALSKISLLGSYYLTHSDRANLEAAAASDRNTAGN